MKPEEYKDRNDLGLVYLAIKKMNLLYMKEEILDIGFIGLVNGYRTYQKEKGALSTYLMVCIENEIKKYLVNQSRIKRSVELTSLSAKTVDELELESVLEDPNPIDIDKKIEYDIICEYLGELKPTYRDIITKYYIYNYSVVEIANMYGQTRQNITTKLNLGMKKLRELLKKKRIL